MKIEMSVSSKRLCIFGLYIYFFFKFVTFFTLRFNEFNMVGLALYLLDYDSVVSTCFGHVACKIVPKMTYNVSSATLNTTAPILC